MVAQVFFFTPYFAFWDDEFVMTLKLTISAVAVLHPRSTHHFSFAKFHTLQNIRGFYLNPSLYFLLSHNHVVKFSLFFAY